MGTHLWFGSNGGGSNEYSPSMIQSKNKKNNGLYTVMSNDPMFCTDRSGQTVQIQIRLLLEEQSDQGLHCLLFPLHHFDKITKGFASLFEF